MEEKAEVGKSILFGIIGVIAFFICYFIVVFLLAMVFVLLLQVPVIKQIIEYIFRVREDSPDIVVVLAGAAAAFAGVRWMIERFCDNSKTESISLYIAGGLIAAMSILFLVMNIMEGNTFFPNIVCGVAGLIMIGSGSK